MVPKKGQVFAFILALSLFFLHLLIFTPSSLTTSASTFGIFVCSNGEFKIKVIE